MFDPRPLCCSSLTTAVGGTKDTNIVDSESLCRGTNQPLTVVRLMKTFKVIKTLEQQERTTHMIKEIRNIEMYGNEKDNDFDDLVNHIIKINGRIQEIVWEGGLLSSVKKYRALRLGWLVCHKFCIDVSK